MIKRVWYSVAMPKPPPLATYVTYEAFTGTPCTLDELKSYLSRFRRTEVLFACALLNTDGRQAAAFALAKQHNILCEGLAFIAWDEAERFAFFPVSPALHPS